MTPIQKQTVNQLKSEGFQVVEINRSIVRLTKGSAARLVRQDGVRMNNHIERTGRALQVLWEQFRSWDHTVWFMHGNGLLKRWHLASKCWALIKHDRILRGDM